jgi:putative addiction module killer protein
MWFELRMYETSDGVAPFRRWMGTIRDSGTANRIESRLARVKTGQIGDHRGVGGGVWELRLKFGPGYRIYLAFEGDRIILLHGGGNKGTQTRDIAWAKEHHRDYQTRKIAAHPELGRLS